MLQHFKLLGPVAIATFGSAAFAQPASDPAQIRATYEGAIRGLVACVENRARTVPMVPSEEDMVRDARMGCLSQTEFYIGAVADMDIAGLQRQSGDLDVRFPSAREIIRERLAASRSTPACPSTVEFVIYFPQTGELTPEAQSVLRDVVTAFRCGDPRRLVLLAGHTDRFGSEAANYERAQRYATSVSNMLAYGMGLPAGSVFTQSLGESSPQADTADGALEPLNRRVTIRFVLPAQ